MVERSVQEIFKEAGMVPPSTCYQLCVRLLPYLAQLFVGLYLLYLSLFFEVKPALEAHFVLWTLVQGITNTALFGSLVTLKFSQYCCACESDEEGGYGIEVPPSDFANCSSILYFLLNCTLGCCGGLWMLAWLIVGSLWFFNPNADESSAISSDFNSNYLYVVGSCFIIAAWSYTILSLLYIFCFGNRGENGVLRYTSGDERDGYGRVEEGSLEQKVMDGHGGYGATS